VFTTRPDTLFGASFVAIAADHPLAQSLAPATRVAAFIERMPQGRHDRGRDRNAEKKGFDTGFRSKHPLDPIGQLPVYVANFVLMDYGTGAIFGCPAHDQRDSISPANTACRSPRGPPKAIRRQRVFAATRPIPAPARLVNSRLPRRHERRSGQGRSHRARRTEGWGRAPP
jgi:leucyl-tRNA synthetase